MGPGTAKPVIVDEERQVAGRVDLQEGDAPLPRLLLDHIRLEAELRQDQAREPRLRAKRIGMQDGHE